MWHIRFIPWETTSANFTRRKSLSLKITLGQLAEQGGMKYTENPESHIVAQPVDGFFLSRKRDLLRILSQLKEMRASQKHWVQKHRISATTSDKNRDHFAFYREIQNSRYLFISLISILVFNCCLIISSILINQLFSQLCLIIKTRTAKIAHPSDHQR